VARAGGTDHRSEKEPSQACTSLYTVAAGKATKKAEKKGGRKARRNGREPRSRNGT